jgi:hypothetical protein
MTGRVESADTLNHRLWTRWNPAACAGAMVLQAVAAANADMTRERCVRMVFMGKNWFGERCSDADAFAGGKALPAAEANRAKAVLETPDARDPEDRRRRSRSEDDGHLIGTSAPAG